MEREFENEDTTVAGVTLGGSPDNTVAVLGAGLLWEISEHMYAVVDYEGNFADDIETHQAIVRIGFPF